MVEIVWQDPPTRRQRPGAYDDLIAVLKQNPGKWALISKDWKTNAAPSVLKQQGCETTTRANKDRKTWSVYARCPISTTNPTRPTAASPVEKAAVQKAVQTGTALTPPPPAVQRPKQEEVRPANDMGLNKFLEARRARGA